MVMRNCSSGHPLDDEIMSGGRDVHLHARRLTQAQRPQPRSSRSTKSLLGRRCVHIVNPAAGNLKHGLHCHGQRSCSC